MGDLRDDLSGGFDVQGGSADLARRRVESAMLEHSVSAATLRGLARKAAVDYYTSSGGSIGGDLLERAIAFVLVPGMQALVSFDSGLSGGVSATTFVYRRMRLRMTDFLRSKAEGFGDSRSGSDGRIVLSADGELRVVAADEDTVDSAAEVLSGGLSDRSAWTLRHVASSLAEGCSLEDILEGLLRDLADELLPMLPTDLRPEISSPSASLEEFGRWFEVAA